MSKANTPFKGFVLKAVNVPSNVILGTFDILESGANTSAQYLSCTHPQSAITHTDNDLKLDQTVEWSPPAQFTGPIVMVATFVKDGYTYWVNVTSDTIMVGSGDIGNEAARPLTTSFNPFLIICVLIMIQ